MEIAKYWKTIVDTLQDGLLVVDPQGMILATNQALIEAIQQRYPAETPAENLSIWNDDYADSMRKVYQRFPDDIG